MAGLGRTLTGGIAWPRWRCRRFFGLARKIENGGSVTVIGTALVEHRLGHGPGDLREFKSTGNSEIVLDRSLAERASSRLSSVLSSSTRRDERLYSEDEMQRLVKLRRWLAGGTPKAAMNGMPA